MREDESERVRGGESKRGRREKSERVGVRRKERYLYEKEGLCKKERVGGRERERERYPTVCQIESEPSVSVRVGCWEML